jgi:hypothetical protein
VRESRSDPDGADDACPCVETVPSPASSRSKRKSACEGRFVASLNPRGIASHSRAGECGAVSLAGTSIGKFPAAIGEDPSVRAEEDRLAIRRSSDVADPLARRETSVDGAAGRFLDGPDAREFGVPDDRLNCRATGSEDADCENWLTMFSSAPPQIGPSKKTGLIVWKSRTQTQAIDSRATTDDCRDNADSASPGERPPLRISGRWSLRNRCIPGIIS